jgi:rsbT co-antagonist protein RsbR
LRPALAGHCCATRLAYAYLVEEEPVSFTTFPPNGHALPVSFAPFRAYLETERSALIKTLAREVTAQLPSYRMLSEDAPEQRIEQNIDAYLAGLDDPAQLIAWTKGQLGPVLMQTMELDGILQIAGLYRQQFIQIGLRALMDGVEGATEGLAKLMDLLDLRLRLFVQFYQERLRLFETLVNNSPDGIGVFSLDGKQLHPNPALRALLGYGDELVGMPFSEYVADNDPAVMQQLMEQGFWQGATTYRRKDGSTFHCHSTIFIINGADGQPLALGGVIRDMSEQLRAADELKRQADELRVANGLIEQSFTASPLATIEWDTQGSVRSWYPAAERIFGWRADEAIGKNIIQLLAPALALEQVQLVVDAILSGQAENSRNLNVTKDGRTIMCQWYNTVLRDGAGNIIGALSQTEDITLQTQREAELQTFYALAENAPDGVLVASPEGEISYANTAMRTLLGFGDDQMSGVKVAAHLDASLTKLEEIGVEIAASGSWRGPLNYRRRDGSIVRCQASSFLIQIGDAAVIASIVRDLTDQQLAEQERLALQDQVIAVQQAALRELSTPLIPLADNVVAMPLIGSIDSARAQQIIEELLTGVAANRATTAIIDITGVPIVDTQVAGALLRAAQAVELLGSRVVITGIRPEVAQTLVGIGVNLGSIVTRATLQDGIGYALRKS